MIADSAKEALDRVLEGERLEATDLHALMQASEQEGLWLDFKDGRLTEDKRECARVLRQYVSGFANSDGGLLIVGISEERPRTITATKRPGGKPLDEWAGDVLADLRAWLTPAPRIHVVQDGPNEVLVIGTARAPRLVPCAQAGETKFFLRFAHGTFEVPPYLATDLVLGRRNHPVLEVSMPPKFSGNGGVNVGCVDVTFSFSLHNVSLVVAEEPMMGLVAWAGPGASEAAIGRLVGGPALRELSTYVNAVAPKKETGFRLVAATSRKQQGREEGAPLRPFETTTIASLGPIPVTYLRTGVRVTTALFVMAKGHPPEWYEVELEVHADGKNPPKVRPIRLERTLGRNPDVSWAPPVTQVVEVTQ